MDTAVSVIDSMYTKMTFDPHPSLLTKLNKQGSSEFLLQYLACQPIKTRSLMTKS